MTKPYDRGAQEYHLTGVPGCEVGRSAIRCSASTPSSPQANDEVVGKSEGEARETRDNHDKAPSLSSTKCLPTRHWSPGLGLGKLWTISVAMLQSTFSKKHGYIHQVGGSSLGHPPSPHHITSYQQTTTALPPYTRQTRDIQEW